jgi:IS5 family transposase
MLVARARTSGLTPPGGPLELGHAPGKRRQLDHSKPVEQMADQLERIKASIRAKVEHPFRVIERQFGHVKVRYRGLAKNTAQLHTLFALANLWMARRQLAGVGT